MNSSERLRDYMNQDKIAERAQKMAAGMGYSNNQQPKPEKVNEPKQNAASVSLVSDDSKEIFAASLTKPEVCSERITITISKSDKAAWKAAAKTIGVSLSEYIRVVINDFNSKHNL